jgi:hypothetical protein
VVGRLAAQHGLVVRLRSTVAGEPNSGTTAGVFIPAELLLHGPGGPEVSAPDYAASTDYAEYDLPADAHADLAGAFGYDDHDHDHHDHDHHHDDHHHHHNDDHHHDADDHHDHHDDHFGCSAAVAAHVSGDNHRADGATIRTVRTVHGGS